MSDSVKFIFKTLFKVPVIIFIAYFILNIFAFSYTYFQMLGFSYVVQQTAVENNYLPDLEYNQLNEYLLKISDTSFIEPGSARIIINDSSESIAEGGFDSHYDASITPARGATNSKRQYGRPVRVGVAYKFKMIWPLMPNEQVEDGENAVVGFSGGTESTFISDDEATARMNAKSPYNWITFTYTVPGLKYYPDLLTY